MMYEYRCKIVRVVDGDTVDVDIDLGFGIWMHKERVRLYGIDTPESYKRFGREEIWTDCKGTNQILFASRINADVGYCQG